MSAVPTSIVIGADFGGNATLIGASANVVVASIAEAKGTPITFRRYLRYGIPATLLTESPDQGLDLHVLPKLLDERHHRDRYGMLSITAESTALIQRIKSAAGRCARR